MSDHKNSSILQTLADTDPKTHGSLDVKNKTDQQDTPALTDIQTQAAVQALNNTSHVERFPTVERRYADPSLELQKIGLISFVPAKGATPNQNGVFGFAKMRGNFGTESEANERSRYLIRNVDSYHTIYHAYVGRPFPLTSSSDYSKEVDRVDLQNEIASAHREDIRQKREKEQRDIEDIKKREKELLEDVKKPQEVTEDQYTTLRVKKAQLMWTYLETEKKMKQMCGSLAQTKHELELLDAKSPELKDMYFNRYVDARQKAGLTTDKNSLDTTFMKYLAEDVKIPAVEAEYQKLFGGNQQPPAQPQ